MERGLFYLPCGNNVDDMANLRIIPDDVLNYPRGINLEGFQSTGDYKGWKELANTSLSKQFEGEFDNTAAQEALMIIKKAHKLKKISF